MKCFYHDDNDGRAAAFCVFAWVGIKRPDSFTVVHTPTGITMRDHAFIPMDYSRPVPWDEIRSGEQVWVVDYSFKPEDFSRLLAITHDVTWIDHHKTAIDRMGACAISGIRQDGEAACSLAWKYIHWWTQRGDGVSDFSKGPPCPEMQVPRMIQLIADRDTWAHKLGAETNWFHAASMSYDTSPMSDFWWRCMDHEVRDLPPPNTGNRTARIKGEKWWAQLLEDGKTIIRYRDRTNADLVACFGFKTEIDGHSAMALNLPRASSEVFDGDSGFEKHGVEILMPFYHDGRQFTVSLYSKSVDCSVIAKARGGGGHKGAAGFQCATLPFARKDQ